MIFRITSMVLVVLAFILLAGVAYQRPNPFGTEHQLIVLGAAFMLFHGAANPKMLLAPTQYKMSAPCKLKSARTLGLIFCVMGLVELTGIFDQPLSFTGV